MWCISFLLVIALNAESTLSFVAASARLKVMSPLHGMLYTGKGPHRAPQPPEPDKNEGEGGGNKKKREDNTPDILKIDLMRDTAGQVSEDDCVPQEDVFGASTGPLPSVSSKINIKEEVIKENLAELWIIGAGRTCISVFRRIYLYTVSILYYA